MLNDGQASTVDEPKPAPEPPRVGIIGDGGGRSVADPDFDWAELGWPPE